MIEVNLTHVGQALIAIGLLGFGSFIGYFLHEAVTNKLLQKWLSKAQLIKDYWKFVIPFIAVLLIAYPSVYFLSPQSFLDTNVNVLGQIATLVFAIFVGWYAFIQVVESRFDKQMQRAAEYFSSGLYNRAAEIYEKLYLAKPRDFDVLGNLLELYILNNDYAKFDDRYDELDKTIVEIEEQLSSYYLLSARQLSVQDNGRACQTIATAIKYAQNNPKALVRFRWNFDELYSSDVYRHLSGDSKKILVNFIKYLENKLTADDKQKFESGNYTLS